ncbi:MAG: hypothetical protein ACOY0T_11965 [Myxococcota bacterium]
MNTKYRPMRAPLGVGVAAACLLMVARAHAQVPPGTVVVDAESEAPPPRGGVSGALRVDRARGTSVSLGPYAGLALLDTQRGGVAHLFAGAVGRLRIRYIELGGNLEVSDRQQESWRMLGGFLGGYIPFENWVDLEFALGAGVRHYLNPDQRYGTGGYDLKVPVLTFRAGFSDRLGQGVFGLRIGGELLVGIDLRHKEAKWSYSYTDLTDVSQVITGKTSVGGTSIGIAVSVALDVAPSGSY